MTSPQPFSLGQKYNSDELLNVSLALETANQTRKAEMLQQELPEKKKSEALSLFDQAEALFNRLYQAIFSLDFETAYKLLRAVLDIIKLIEILLG